MIGLLRRLWYALSIRALLYVLAIVAVVALYLTVPARHRHLISPFEHPAAYLLAAFVVTLAGYALYLALSYRTASSVVPATAFLDAQRGGDREFCLLLRPFGADGFIALPQHGSSNRWLKRFLTFGVRMSRIVEQVIESRVRAAFGCETVALVDPSMSLLPPSPRFLESSGAAWQDAIDRLLRRARIVGLVLPPGLGVGASVRWEIRRILELGLAERLLVVLPPPESGREHSDAWAALQSLADLLPELAAVPEGAVLVHVGTAGDCAWWFPQPGSGRATDALYADCLDRAFARMRAAGSGVRRAGRVSAERRIRLLSSTPPDRAGG